VKTIYRTYRFELQPTQEQKVLLDKHFGCVRFVFNHFLNERKEQYQADKKSDNYYKQAATLTELKNKEETAWLKEVNSQSLQFALRCLDTAYVNFFRGNAKFPRFKSRKKKNSFTVPQFAKLEGGRFYTILQYKMQEHGGNYLEIGRFEPSSRMCSCGVINKDLKLSDRTWVCKSCGTINERDVLAANNILKFALNPKNKTGQVLSDEPMETLALVRSVK